MKRAQVTSFEDILNKLDQFHKVINLFFKGQQQ